MKAKIKSELSAILEEEAERLDELLVLYGKKLENIESMESLSSD